MVFFKRRNGKIVAGVGIGVVSYYAASSSGLVPAYAWLTSPIMPGVNVVVIAAGLALYGLYLLTLY